MTRGRVLGLLVLLAAQLAWAHPAQIIIFRHAEKPDDTNNPHLSPDGVQRANLLPTLFEQGTPLPELISNGPPAVIFAARPVKGSSSLRCIETARPLARALHRRLAIGFSAFQHATLARRLLISRAYRGKTVVICWPHDFIPMLAQELGVQNPPSWDGGTYDRIWVITYDDAGNAMLDDLPQHLLPGDSKH